jgi:hypothetical protein
MTVRRRKQYIAIVGDQRIGISRSSSTSPVSIRLPARGEEDEAGHLIVGTGFDFSLPWLQARPHAGSRTENAAPTERSLTSWRDFLI